MTRWFRREINLGDTGPDVDWIRRKLVMHPGKGDPVDFAFQAHVRAFQFAHHLPTTGVVDEATADALGEPAYLPRPDWWRGPLHHHDPGYGLYLEHLGIYDVFAVRRLRNSLEITPGDVIDEELMDCLSLWQHV